MVKRLHRQKTRLFHDNVGIIKVGWRAAEESYLFLFGKSLIPLSLRIFLCFALLEQGFRDENLVLCRDGANCQNGDTK